jgi:hypothetical protein
VRKIKCLKKKRKCEQDSEKFWEKEMCLIWGESEDRIVNERERERYKKINAYTHREGEREREKEGERDEKRKK